MKNLNNSNGIVASTTILSSSSSYVGDDNKYNGYFFENDEEQQEVVINRRSNNLLVKSSGDTFPIKQSSLSYCYGEELTWNDDYKSNSLFIYIESEETFLKSITKDLESISIFIPSLNKRYSSDVYKILDNWILNINSSNEIWFNFLVSLWKNVKSAKDILRKKPFLHLAANAMFYLYYNISTIRENKYSNSSATTTIWSNNDANNVMVGARFSLFEVMRESKILYFNKRKIPKNILHLGFICQNSTCLVSEKEKFNELYNHKKYEIDILSKANSDSIKDILTPVPSKPF
jgi:hypothetical protein